MTRLLLGHLSKVKNVMFDCTETTLLQYNLPLIRELSKDRRIKIYIQTNKNINQIRDILTPFFNTTYYIERDVSINCKGIHLYISPHIYSHIPKKTISIHISHNQPVKFTTLPKKQFEKFDYHFTVGPLHYQQCVYTKKKYSIDISLDHFKKVGYPKSDKLYSLTNEKSLNEIGNALKIDLTKKTILYAPSWEDGLSLREQGNAIFSVLSKMKSYNVLIKLHPVSYTKKSSPNYKLYTGENNWEEIVDKYCIYTHMKHILDFESEKYVAIADIMISDISGIALEFMSIKKPVIFIDSPNFFTKNKHLYNYDGEFAENFILKNPLVNAGRHAGYLIKKISNIPMAVNYLLKHPYYKNIERLNIAKNLRYNPGKSTISSVNEILKILGLDSI